MFVIQYLKFEMTDGVIQPILLSGNDIGPWLGLKTIDEISFTPYTLLRLSRISNIKSFSEDESSEVDLRETLLTADPVNNFEIDTKGYDTWLKTLP